MKHLIVTAVALTLIFTLSSCSGGQAKAPNALGSSASTQTESSSGSAGDIAAVQSYMGRVSDKVGNDITINETTGVVERLMVM